MINHWNFQEWLWMDNIFKICITCKFSDFVVRSLLSANGPYSNMSKRCRVPNSVDPDQTTTSGAVWSGSRIAGKSKGRWFDPLLLQFFRPRFCLHDLVVSGTLLSKPHQNHDLHCLSRLFDWILRIITDKTRGPLVLYRSPECWGYAELEQTWKYKSTQCSISSHPHRSIRNKFDPVIKMVKVNPRSSFEKSPRAWAYDHLVQVPAAF